MATLTQVKKSVEAHYFDDNIDGWIIRTFGFVAYVWAAIAAGALLATVVIIMLIAWGIL